MSGPQCSLVLTLKGSHGQMPLSYALELSPDVAQEIARIDPPLPFGLSGGFDAVVKILRRKEFRKDLFVETATRLGHLLAAYMEDREGWHGAERQERIREREKAGG